MSAPIYVETTVNGTVEELWEASQQPHLHEQWDVRFSSITYRPKERENDPQLFTYETTVIPGITVSGWGRSVGNYKGEDGSRTSSLHFGTTQKISPIKEGRGYWKYIPTDHGTTFITQYDFDARWGDRWFRPLIGWGTALSFDVFKRWLEKKEAPRSQYMRFLTYWLLTFFFAFIWMYHGFVPKLLAMHPREVSLATNPLIPAESVVLIAGIVEIGFGLIWLILKQKKVLFLLQMVAFPFLTLAAVSADLQVLVHPFSPITYNASLLMLSVIGLMVSGDIPSARSCKRSP
ncbi:DoxX-like family protein [Halobacillus locisalis]|uniref:DoxX-like family protein n=1 Tax=Halobacillus locisalis TaxID=220753 RepID=A0A838CQ31_9BACI|nr:DoxX-like family protein [Halobacillus locisalis]MBA2174177.1 DoxX-like family protein [Halobacillus locisalis]